MYDKLNRGRAGAETDENSLLFIYCTEKGYSEVGRSVGFVPIGSHEDAITYYSFLSYGPHKRENLEDKISK